jgi:hypothetical protein
MSGPRRTLDEQMLADWAAVGLRKLEALLARHAAFCDFLRDRRPDADEREEPCPPQRAA